MMLDLKNLNRFQAWLIIYQHKSMVYRESKISIPEKHHPSARLVAVFLPELVTDYWYQCKVSYGYQSMELISLWSVVSRELQGTISWVSIIDDKIPMVGHSMDTPSLFIILFWSSPLRDTWEYCLHQEGTVIERWTLSPGQIWLLIKAFWSLRLCNS